MEKLVSYTAFTASRLSKPFPSGEAAANVFLLVSALGRSSLMIARQPRVQAEYKH